MAKHTYAGGVALLIVGCLILLGKWGVLQFLGSLFWPVFILLPGLIFHFLYFARVLPSGVLVPGGILTVYSLMFFLCTFFGWDLMAYIWPGFLFGVAVGLYEFYLFYERHPRGVLLAAAIVAIVSLVFFGFTILFTVGVYIFALALIILGALLMLRRSRASW